MTKKKVKLKRASTILFKHVQKRKKSEITLKATASISIAVRGKAGGPGQRKLCLGPATDEQINLRFIS